MSVRFANGNDGWIFGSLETPPKVSDEPMGTFVSILWSTHDGGRAWSPQPQTWIYRQGTFLDLEATAKTVYVMSLNKTFNVTVESSLVGADYWRVSKSQKLFIPAGGGFLSGAFVFSGSHGWLVEGNDRGVSGSAELTSSGQWAPWTPPCYTVGNSLAPLVASTPTRLFTECQMGGFASQLSKTAPHGAPLGSTWLYESKNAGRTFTAVKELGLYDEFFGTVIASPSPNSILITEGHSQIDRLLATFDAGRHWSVVYLRGPL